MEEQTVKPRAELHSRASLNNIKPEPQTNFRLEESKKGGRVRTCESRKDWV